MNGHQTEYVDALLDGELTGLRRWRVTRHVRACPLCAAEYRKQRHVRRLLRANPPQAEMSDSATFFWSKVKKEIEHREPERMDLPQTRTAWADWLGQHRYALATAAVVVGAAVAALMLRPGRPTNQQAAAPPAIPVLAAVGATTTSLPDTVATVLPGETPELSVIWVSGLPWTADLTEMQTLYAHPHDYLEPAQTGVGI